MPASGKGESVLTGFEAARSALDQLTGRRFTTVGRAATLVWFAFGDEVPWVDHRGEQTVRPELALHVQCPWRLLRGGDVLVEQADLYVPGAQAEDGFVGGGEIGSTRFDDRVEAVAGTIAAESPVVEALSLDEKFALRLVLSCGLALEVVPAEREGWEDWRFISSAAGRRHYVVENGALSVA